MINFYNEIVKKPDIESRRVKGWIKDRIGFFNKKVGEINIVFCSDDYLLDYNRKFLNHDYYTDIITFNYNENNKVSGDLFISIDTVTKNAEYYNVSFNDELLRVIIHGVLHLLGYNDTTDEEVLEMRKQEKQALDLYYSI